MVLDVNIVHRLSSIHSILTKKKHLYCWQLLFFHPPFFAQFCVVKIRVHSVRQKCEEKNASRRIKLEPTTSKS